MHIDEATTRITSNDKPGKNAQKLNKSFAHLTVYTSTHMFLSLCNFVKVLTCVTGKFLRQYCYHSSNT